MFKSVGTMSSAFLSSRFWMSFIFVCGTCGLIDYFLLGCRFIFNNSLSIILQRLINQRGELTQDYKLPKCISNRINMYKTFEQQKVHLENEKYKVPQNTEDIDRPFEMAKNENNKHNEEISYDITQYPLNTTGDDDIFPYFQRASKVVEDDFIQNFGEIQRNI